MYKDITQNEPIIPPNSNTIKEMESIYSSIMKNLQLMNIKKSTANSNFEECKDCFSCNIS